MPLRPSGKLPSRFNRAFHRSLRTFVKRKYDHKRSWKREKLKRSMRRAQQTARQWERILFLWLIGVIVGLVLLGIGLALFSPLLHIREIRVVRMNPRLDIEHVQQVLSPLFGRHLLFLTDNDVDELLYADIEDLDRIDVEKVYPSQLIVRISLHDLLTRVHIIEPDEEPEAETGSGSSIDFLTEEGVYVQAFAIPDTESLPLVSLTDWGVKPTPGNALVSKDVLDRLWAAEAMLSDQFGHEIEARTVFLRGQEMHITADGVALWFDMRSSLERHIQRYRLFLQSVPRDQVKEYVDLRLMDRVVYR